jgi:thioredoxin-like negative regulator of GroEL
MRLPRALRPRKRFHRARQKLVRARELFDRGDFAGAAPVFEKLAQATERRGMLDRAGDLRMELARCHIKLDNMERADQESLHGLRLFLRARHPIKVRRLLPRMVAMLEQHGRHDEAKELREKAEQLLGPMPARPAIEARGILPAKCPNCGGPLKPDEVHWTGHNSAECPYCGSVVPAI